MERSRKNKKIILGVLILAILGLSVGFAAFNAQLTIEPSAEVKPDKNSFKVVFSTSATEALPGTPEMDGTYATGGTFEQDATTITDLKANFTEPGQTATWKVYAFNGGKYEAFLNSVQVGGITCTAKEGTTQAFVDEAAKGISLKVKIGEKEYTVTDTNGVTDDAINEDSLDIGESEEVFITLTYAADSERADGDFDVAIGNIIFTYNSID